MEYMENREFWDEKFASRSDKILDPEKSLVENIEFFKPGTVLDIACGDGRNALFLLEKGFEVTGVDFSKQALSRLEMFAKRSGYSVSTKEVDLSLPNALKNIGIFDNVIINHYRLSKEQLADIESYITDGGILFICGFGHKHRADSRIRQEDLIQPTDLEGLSRSFDVIRHMESQDDRGFIVTYVFRKKKI